MREYRFIPYEPDKPLELAPDIRKRLPPNHLALFISYVVDSLDLGEITGDYLHLQGGHPAMMLKLLFYGYCAGIRSSRRIEQKTYEDVAFRVLFCDSQVIVCAEVTQQANDKQQLVPMLRQREENLGEIPDRVLADGGYFTEEAVESVVEGFMEPFIPQERKKHRDLPEPAPRGRIPDNASVVDRALGKLKTKVGQQTYSKRKETIEPVFGQIKEGRGIRAFLLREKVKGEGAFVCLTHNILKLRRHLWLDEGRSAPVFG